jgi:hypothetical protein
MTCLSVLFWLFLQTVVQHIEVDYHLDLAEEADPRDDDGLEMLERLDEEDSAGLEVAEDSEVFHFPST